MNRLEPEPTQTEPEPAEPAESAERAEHAEPAEPAPRDRSGSCGNTETAPRAKEPSEPEPARSLAPGWAVYSDENGREFYWDAEHQATGAGCLLSLSHSHSLS